MTEEELKAVEVLKVKYLSEYLDDEEVKSLFKHIEKQDKMINLMADFIFETTDYEGEKIYSFKNKQEIKECFRKRVEEDGKENRSWRLYKRYLFKNRKNKII